MPRFVALSAHAEAGTLSVCTDKLSEIRSPKAVISRVWGHKGDLIPESAEQTTGQSARVGPFCLTDPTICIRISNY
jgi:hypothetical protein